jgi:hypothetical protein
MGISTFLDGQTPSQLRGLLWLSLSDLGQRGTATLTDDSGGGGQAYWTYGSSIPCRIDPINKHGRSRVWHSNAPHSPTGYGQQTALFAPSSPSTTTWRSRRSTDSRAPRSSGRASRSCPDWAAVRRRLAAQARRALLRRRRQGRDRRHADGRLGLDPSFMRKMNCAAWVPVDHEPVPQKVVNYFTNSGAVPIAMSRFGERMLGRLDPLYVPHAVDCRVPAARPQGDPRARRAPRGHLRRRHGRRQQGPAVAQGLRPGVPGVRQVPRDARELDPLPAHDDEPALAGGRGPPGAARALDVPQENVRIADQYRMLFDPYGHADDGEDLRLARRAAEPGDGRGLRRPDARSAGVRRARSSRPTSRDDGGRRRRLARPPGAGWARLLVGPQHVAGVPRRRRHPLGARGVPRAQHQAARSSTCQGRPPHALNTTSTRSSSSTCSRR